MLFIDLPAQYKALKTQIDSRIQTVLNHGKYIMGPEVAELEAGLCGFVSSKHCVTCANGTDALQMLFMAFGVGAGDAVFCPDVTFVASVEPACMMGAAPIFCDIDPRTYNISPSSLERQVKAVIEEGKYNPKAVVAVDLFGNPADFDGIRAICQRHDIILIEDAAQSFGAEYHGKKCAGFGHASAVSFFPAKPLGCYGDGGAVFTDDDKLAGILRSIRIHGQGPRGKYDNIMVGINSRLDTLQAAILLPKLEALKKYEMDARQLVAARYNNAFKGKYETPYVPEGCLSAYAQYVLLARDGQHRDAIINKLGKSGIPCNIYYPTPQHLLPVFADACLYNEGLTNSISFCERTFSLPMHPYLTEDEQDKIINAVEMVDD